MSKVISIIGKGKINFSKDKDREKMEKKYPDVEFGKMNPASRNYKFDLLIILSFLLNKQ